LRPILSKRSASKGLKLECGTRNLELSFGRLKTVSLSNGNRIFAQIPDSGFFRQA
jgi:hypothetical protein